MKNLLYPNKYRIEMIVTSLVDEKTFKNGIVNCLTGVERKKGLVIGVDEVYKITRVT